MNLNKTIRYINTYSIKCKRAYHSSCKRKSVKVVGVLNEKNDSLNKTISLNNATVDKEQSTGVCQDNNLLVKI